MAVNKNTNTQNNNQDVKVVVNVEAPTRKRKATPRKPPQPASEPPPAPVQNVIVKPLNTTLIPGFDTPDYFNTALTNQQMSLAALMNAMERKVDHDYENVAVTAGNVMGGVQPSAPPMPEEQAAVNNPTAVEEPVLFAQPPPQQPILERIPSDAFLQQRFDESGEGELDETKLKKLQMVWGNADPDSELKRAADIRLKGIATNYDINIKTPNNRLKTFNSIYKEVIAKLRQINNP
jgi:hypothetical protein